MMTYCRRDGWDRAGGGSVRASPSISPHPSGAPPLPLMRVLIDLIVWCVSSQTSLLFSTLLINIEGSDDDLSPLR
jgi:hypothetical protein